MQFVIGTHSSHSSSWFCSATSFGSSPGPLCIPSVVWSCLVHHSLVWEGTRVITRQSFHSFPSLDNQSRFCICESFCSLGFCHCQVKGSLGFLDTEPEGKGERRKRPINQQENFWRRLQGGAVLVKETQGTQVYWKKVGLKELLLYTIFPFFMFREMQANK